MDELQSFINQNNFDIKRNFFLNLNGDVKRELIYSTKYTMDMLDYDEAEIVETLKTLSVEDYSETKIDTDNTHPPLLFVFGKIIQNKEVYIKVKLKQANRKYIVACISFHFSKNRMSYPYRENRR